MSDELAREPVADGLYDAGKADLVEVLLEGARTEFFCGTEVELD
jgi:hypothetical protein